MLTIIPFYQKPYKETENLKFSRFNARLLIGPL